MSSTTTDESLARLGFTAAVEEDGEPIIVHQQTGAFILGDVDEEGASLIVENELYSFTADQLDGFTEKFWSLHGDLDEYTAKYL